MANQYLQPNPAALKRIKHILVLMLENRSFDNLLGWLYAKEAPPRDQEFDGLRDDLWNPLDNIDSDGVPFVEKVYVRRNGAAPKGRSSKRAWHEQPDYTLPNPDPGEGYQDTNYQLFQKYAIAHGAWPQRPYADSVAPTNMGFVDNYRDAMLYATLIFGEKPTDPREIMTCYTPEQTPVLSRLAREFAVCDQWFASVPSQTLPNRAFIHAATSCSQVNNKPQALFDARTIFNQIEDAIRNEQRTDLSWKVYHGTAQVKRPGSGEPWEQGQDFSLTRLTLTQLHDRAFDGNFRLIDEFYQDAANGSLPSYAFLEPQFYRDPATGRAQNDQHPPSDIRAGEKLIADVYRAVVQSPQWNETLLVITYDEHGGCYDHVAPPNTATPPDGQGNPGQLGFEFNRFGLRVPAVLISPYIEPGAICRPAGYTPFDHTSVIATIQNCFDLKDHLTKRDAVAPDLSCVLTLTEPRTDQPEVDPAPAESEPDPEHVNDLHRSLEWASAQLVGRTRREDQDVFEFSGAAYAEKFGVRAR
ncbi:MAG TPA: alkaline phosphatase family protein [Anaerolineae bacterium]|nr:alkaline phosphatase family protein [Anaerolineae bacterium]